MTFSTSGMSAFGPSLRRLDPNYGRKLCFFFPPAPFFRRRSQVDDCFTGQSPGNAISIPAAPDVHEGLGQIQASAP